MACNFIPIICFFFFYVFQWRVIFTLAEQQVPAIYVFGDSLVDVGNNDYLVLSLAKANFPHNGIDFPNQKPTGRFSNGKNATSPPYLSLVSNTNTSSYLAGVSFASGGAGIFNVTDLLYTQLIPLTEQVDYYLSVYDKVVQQLGSSGAPKHLSKSLFAIVIGSNDIFGYLSSSEIGKEITPQQYVNSMVITLEQQLKRLHRYGARKFLVVGIGSIGCCPSERVKNKAEECNQETNYWSTKYNDGLKSMLQQLKSELKDINYSYFDTYAVLLDIIQKPTSYGFKEAKAACCGLGSLNAIAPCLPVSSYCSNRSNHVFWDRKHPTEAAHSILTGYIFDGPQQYSFPLNVKQLIAL